MDNIPQGTPSLLLALLEDVKNDPRPYTTDVKTQENITAVVDAIKPPRERSLTKDVAQKELYEILYSIIEKEYDESKKDPEQDKQNADLNKAIGLALEIGIKVASGKAPMIPHENAHLIPDLREALRTRIIAALKPKEA